MKPHRTARRRHPDALSRLRARANTSAPGTAPGNTLDALDAHCRRCGAEPAIGAHHVLVTGEVVCPDCTRPTDEITHHVLLLGETPDGSEPDRAWFAANAGTDWRLRKALPGEARELSASARYLNTIHGVEKTEGVPQDATHVLTIQISPGMRIRLPCFSPDNPADVAEWLEWQVPKARAYAHEMFRKHGGVNSVTNQVARYAATMDIVGRESFWNTAAEQGAAMKEGRGQTRQ